MIRFNLSFDFELGWGDLCRVARDDAFHARVLAGTQHVPEVLGALTRHRVPSTWGVVGACCCDEIEQLQQRAPRAFATVQPLLDELRTRRRDWSSVLFSRSIVELLSGTAEVQLGSHGFLHLVPDRLPVAILREDVQASVATLRAMCGKPVESFIPPQNYHWPDAAFAGTGIRFVRHTPSVWSRPYSDPALPAKFARLWNDLVRPSRHAGSEGRRAQLLFLRLDRGRRIWAAQLALLRGLIAAGAADVYCYAHPHNLDCASTIAHLCELLEVVALSRERGELEFADFFRELPVAHAAADAL